MESQCIQASQLQSRDVRRAATGFLELDWLFGVSHIYGKHIWGMPEGGISLMSGEGGVGKSRLAIEMAKRQIAGGLKVLYTQIEIDLRSFGRWVKNAPNSHLLYCSNAKSLDEQIATIKRVAPHLVLIDSVNEIEDFRNGTAKDIREVINRFRQEITLRMPLHLIFLAQLNKDGTTKGSTTLSHLVDTTFEVKRLGGPCFVLKVGHKHRFGRTGAKFWSEWVHTDSGVECQSSHREEDERWCTTHGIPDIPQKGSETRGMRLQKLAKTINFLTSGGSKPSVEIVPEI